MKVLKRILLVLLGLMLLVAASVFFWLRSSKPVYSGELKIQGLHKPVDVYYDDYGIPHVDATDKHDLYLAFGYIHAQDRLFQMEMLRRVGSGRLAEIIGRPVLQVDKLFRSIGLPEYAKESAHRFEQNATPEMKEEVFSYIEGINQFIQSGETPPEFSIIGIEKTAFTLEDMYSMMGAMSFSFSQAQKTEPVIDHIARNYSPAYLEDMGLWHKDYESFIPNSGRMPLPQEPSEQELPQISGHAARHPLAHEAAVSMALVASVIEDLLPVAPLEGSNAWVVGGSRTKSGEVIFCNDTHIGYMLPQTWYEAHLRAPGFEIYGHFMAGLPYALIGRNRNLSWGLTMLLNDDMDFYMEKEDSEHPGFYLYKDSLHAFETQSVTIHIKGEADTTLQLRKTIHGPVVNDAFVEMKRLPPLAMSWTYIQLPNDNMHALYGMNNARNIQSFESSLPHIHAPGLSINYGDTDGHYAWWACARLLKRKADINSWTLLDGSSGEEEPLGYYSFEENPRSIDPEWGFIYSANDWPGAFTDSSGAQIWYPGYYKPQYRADRIRQLLSASREWDLESMKSVMTDNRSIADSALMAMWYHELNEHASIADSSIVSDYAFLFFWDGSYTPNSTSPVLFNRMLYYYLKFTMEDELGPELFQLFLQSHQVQRTQLILYHYKNSPWWDDVHTTSKESRSDIIARAYTTTIAGLEEEFGKNPMAWTWRKCLSLELKHPLGEVAALRPLFNVGEEAIYGGNETILQSGFKLDSTGHYKVHFGSQMRIIVDFANVDSALNITPSGQSGHLMSSHYEDQAKLYRERSFRAQWMNWDVIQTKDKLILSP